MNPLYIWLAIWVFFIIVEMMTVTLYGLSMALWAFIAGVYTYFTYSGEINIIQILIFVIISTVCIFIFPKFFHLSKWNAKIWIEMYVGKVFKLKKVWSDWKVTIDWVDYLINDDSIQENFEVGKKVKVDSCDWTILNVSLIK